MATEALCNAVRWNITLGWPQPEGQNYGYGLSTSLWPMRYVAGVSAAQTLYDVTQITIINVTQIIKKFKTLQG